MTKLTPVASASQTGKRWSGLRVLVLVLIIAFYATLLVYGPALPLADDMPRHVTNGELILSGDFRILFENVYSYTDPGQPFVNHHWLSGVVFYLFLILVNWQGLVLLKAGTYTAAFLIVFFAAVRKSDFWTVALFSVPAILILMERTSLRPEMWSYLFIAVFIYLLTDLDEHPERRHVYWLIPLQLLWVNMHIFFSIGIMMVGAYLASKMLTRLRSFWKDPLIGKLSLVFVGVALISFVNPHGAEGVFYRYPADFPIQISENQTFFEYREVSAPTDDIAATVYIPLVVALGASLVYGLYRRRVTLFVLFGSIATATLGFHIMRGIYFFGFFFLLGMAAIWGPDIARLRAYIEKRLPLYARSIGIACALTFCIALIVLSFPTTTRFLTPFAASGINPTVHSFDAAQFMNEVDIRGPIFNNADIGSYLIYTLYPKERVFVDNLFGDAYSAETFKELHGMVQNEDAWHAGVARYDFNAIVFYPYDAGANIRPFLYDRFIDPEWVLVYVDPYVMIYVRNRAENQAMIDAYRITNDNIHTQLAHLRDAEDFDAAVAYADLANLIGRTDLGLSAMKDIVARWPEKGKMWSVTAQWMLSDQDNENPNDAVHYLETAIALGYTSAETYSFLGLAYFRVNDIERAKDALTKALSKNPERRDAHELLEQIQRLEASTYP